MKRMLIIVIIIIAVGIVVGVLSRGDGVLPSTTVPTSSTDGTPPGEVVGIAPGNKAPGFTLQTFEGEPVTLSDFAGRPVIVDFWAGWCPFCIEEMPELEAISQEFSSEGLVVLGVHRSETESIERGASFAEERGVTYPLLQDTNGAVYRAYSGGQQFMPIAYFIDADGIIRNRVLGPKTAQQMRANVEAIIRINEKR